jgi:hypothetical protein
VTIMTPRIDGIVVFSRAAIRRSMRWPPLVRP